MKIQKRRQQLEALQFDIDKPGDMIAFLGSKIGHAYLGQDGRVLRLQVGSLEFVSDGEWVVKLGNGQFGIMSDEQFHSMYEVIE